jgi:hypothetical protein
MANGSSAPQWHSSTPDSGDLECAEPLNQGRPSPPFKHDPSHNLYCPGIARHSLGVPPKHLLIVLWPDKLENLQRVARFPSQDSHGEVQRVPCFDVVASLGLSCLIFPQAHDKREMNRAADD